MTPVQTSPRVCVRTSHSPVSPSLPRSSSPSPSLSAHTRRGAGAKSGASWRIPWDCWGGISTPWLCVACTSPNLPARASPRSRLQPSAGQRPPLSLGPETRHVRKGRRCRAPGRRVGAGDARGAGADRGLTGLAGPTELASRRRRLPTPPAAAAPRGLPRLRTSVGLLPAPPLAL